MARQLHVIYILYKGYIREKDMRGIHVAYARVHAAAYLFLLVGTISKMVPVPNGIKARAAAYLFLLVGTISKMAPVSDGTKASADAYFFSLWGLFLKWYLSQTASKPVLMHVFFFLRFIFETVLARVPF